MLIIKQFLFILNYNQCCDLFWNCLVKAVLLKGQNKSFHMFDG